MSYSNNSIVENKNFDLGLIQSKLNKLVEAGKKTNEIKTTLAKYLLENYNDTCSIADENGNVLCAIENNGKQTTKITSTYDDDNVLIKEVIQNDSDNNGKINENITRSFDPKTGKLKYQNRFIDSDNDGHYDSNEQLKGDGKLSFSFKILILFFIFFCD